MCLDACCCSIPLDIGCFIISTVILLFKFSTLAWIIHNVNLGEREEITAEHLVTLLLIVSTVIPIFLMCGAATRSPCCVCFFVTLETLFVIVMTVWQIYFITNNLEYKGGDVIKQYKKNYYFLFVTPFLLALQLYFLIVACSFYHYIHEMRYWMPRPSYGRQPLYYI